MNCHPIGLSLNLTLTLSPVLPPSNLHQFPLSAALLPLSLHQKQIKPKRGCSFLLQPLPPSAQQMSLSHMCTSTAHTLPCPSLNTFEPLPFNINPLDSPSIHTLSCFHQSKLLPKFPSCRLSPIHLLLQLPPLPSPALSILALLMMMIQHLLPSHPWVCSWCRPPIPAMSFLFPVSCFSHHTCYFPSSFPYSFLCSHATQASHLSSLAYIENCECLMI